MRSKRSYMSFFKNITVPNVPRHIETRVQHPESLFPEGVMQTVFDYSGDKAFMVPEEPSLRPTTQATSNVVRDLLVKCDGDIDRLGQKEKEALLFVARYVRHLDLTGIDLD